MLTNYFFMIPIRSKTTTEVIKAYLKDVYCTSGGSIYILRDRGGGFTSEQFAWLYNILGFIKVSTFPHTLKGSLLIEWTHAFLKASL